MSGVPPTCRLALADGSLFSGVGFGASAPPTTRVAEVVFNTAMTGYQEALTDPSYAGQILVMTSPLIGNYGANAIDLESSKSWVAGFVVRELARRHSNHRADSGLSDWLASQGVPGLSGVDTRALTRRLRSAGVMNGAISTDASKSDAELVRLAAEAPSMDGQNLAAGATCAGAGDWGGSGTGGAKDHGEPLTVFALDCGAKRNILRHLRARGCNVEVLPYDTPGERLREAYAKGEMDGLFISNGPGDPAAVGETVAALREVLTGPKDRVPPTFGICLGHQLLALALGAATYKLKFGHRGVNQPVRNLLTGRVEITSQNHGFAVESDSIRGAGGEPTHINLNDGSLAGFRLTDRPVFAVQHHPEAHPGPNDAAYLFDAFVGMMRTRRPVGDREMAGRRAPAGA